MKPINQAAAKTLGILIEGLDKPGDARKVQNSTSFMAVSVENIGGNQFSVAHYGEQNGDLMRDPEMIFWKGADGRFYPTYFRNDYVGSERVSVHFDEQGQPSRLNRREQADQASFAGTWLRNIWHQQEFSKQEIAPRTFVA